MVHAKLDRNQLRKERPGLAQKIPRLRQLRASDLLDPKIRLS